MTRCDIVSVEARVTSMQLMSIVVSASRGRIGYVIFYARVHDTVCDVDMTWRH